MEANSIESKKMSYSGIKREASALKLHFLIVAPNLWNSIPLAISMAPILMMFQMSLKS